MSKREKIIVSVMVVTVLLGGFFYFMPGVTGRPPGGGTEFDESTRDFVQQVHKKFKADTTLAREMFAIRSAQRQWAKDPFLHSDARLSDQPQSNVPDAAPVAAGTRLDLKYNGFVEAGAQRLAIINGMEYASGEAIDGRGYYLRRIQPGQVEIGKRNAPDVIILKMTE